MFSVNTIQLFFDEYLHFISLKKRHPVKQSAVKILFSVSCFDLHAVPQRESQLTVSSHNCFFHKQKPELSVKGVSHNTLSAHRPNLPFEQFLA